MRSSSVVSEGNNRLSIKDNKLLRQAANSFPPLIPQLQEVISKNGRSMTHIDFPVNFLRRRASFQGMGVLRNEYGRQKIQRLILPAQPLVI